MWYFSRLEYDINEGYKPINGVTVTTLPIEKGTHGISFNFERLYEIGYEQDKNLRAAPYDWRYAAGM